MREGLLNSILAAQRPTNEAIYALVALWRRAISAVSPIKMLIFYGSSRTTPVRKFGSYPSMIVD